MIISLFLNEQIPSLQETSDIAYKDYLESGNDYDIYPFLLSPMSIIVYMNAYLQCMVGLQLLQLSHYLNSVIVQQ